MSLLSCRRFDRSEESLTEEEVIVKISYPTFNHQSKPVTPHNFEKLRQRL